MSAYDRFEMKVGSLIVGVLAVMLALIIATPNPYEPLHVILHDRGRDADWAAAIGILALMTLYGSLRPKRPCRQIGLIGLGFFMLIVFGVMMVNWSLSFSTLLLFILGIAALALFAGDVLIYSNRANAEGP